MSSENETHIVVNVKRELSLSEIHSKLGNR